MICNCNCLNQLNSIKINDLDKPHKKIYLYPHQKFFQSIYIYSRRNCKEVNTVQYSVDLVHHILGTWHKKIHFLHIAVNQNNLSDISIKHQTVFLPHDLKSIWSWLCWHVMGLYFLLVDGAM